jgi:transposase-like protein
MEDKTKLETALDELLTGKTTEEIVGPNGLLKQPTKSLVEVPGDRNGTYDPKIIPKHGRRFAGFDQKILSMYARGMTTRDIQGHLEEMYGVEVSPSPISEVTDAVVEEVRAWQSRPLEPIYPILYLDALMVKMRHEGRVENRAVFGDRGDAGREQRGVGAVDERGGGR